MTVGRRGRFVQYAFLAAVLLAVAGAAAAALDSFGIAFIRTPDRWAGPTQPKPDGSAASSATAPALSFADQPRPVPEIHFVGGDGSALTLADFRGRVILLNLWATWCVPCRKEMPALDRLQAALGGPDFQVVPLSIDRQGAAVVKPFYRELGIKALSIYLDQSATATQALSAVGVPTSVLIDRDGREIARKLGAAEWDSAEMIRTIRQRLGPPAHAGATPVGATQPR